MSGYGEGQSPQEAHQLRGAEPFWSAPVRPNSPTDPPPPHQLTESGQRIDFGVLCPAKLLVRSDVSREANSQCPCEFPPELKRSNAAKPHPWLRPTAQRAGSGADRSTRR